MAGIIASDTSTCDLLFIRFLTDNIVTAYKNNVIPRPIARAGIPK